jgi:hypothetical protein
MFLPDTLRIKGFHVPFPGGGHQSYTFLPGKPAV